MTDTLPDTDIDTQNLIPDSLELDRPSSSLVYIALRLATRPISTTEIADRMSMPKSSARRGLRELKDRNIVVEETCPEDDLRSRRYTLRCRDE